MRSFETRIPAARSRTIPVHLGSGALDRLVADASTAFAGRLVVVISDDRVAPLHGDRLVEKLRAAGLEAELLPFPAGERHKRRDTKAAIEDRLLELGAGRDTIVIALGGGVTGDVAGFVAATWHRGVPIVQAPTSLLAMADSALGGKTAVDLPDGKNLVGAFHQPAAIYADLETLSTLPEPEYVAGFAEMVKTAVIGDAALFRRLEASVAALRARDTTVLEDVLGVCLAFKARIVRRDERESGVRAILNHGHTVAHAIETASDYRLRHGEALAVGLVVEAGLAARHLDFPERHVRRVRLVLEALGLGTRWPEGVSREAVAEAARRDKKGRRGETRYALPLRIGKMPSASVTIALDEACLREALARHD